MTKQYQKLFKYENVDLEFTDGALTIIDEKALQRGHRHTRFAWGLGAFTATYTV